MEIDPLKLAIYAYGSALVWDLYWDAIERPRLGEAILSALFGWPGALIVWCFWRMERMGCE
jgi:hypothetical protein